MFDDLKSAVLSWNTSTSQRQKLQHTYFFISVLTVIVAGIVSLIEADTGRNMLRIALFAGVVFFTNAIVWNLLESGLIAKLANKRRPRRR